MMLYDHVNYARWGVFYLLDMLQLENTAPEVHAEFIARNFVVKETAGSFNKIAADQALEHINKQGKIAAGITKVPSAMNLFNPFERTCEELICILTNDVASNEIRNDILSVTIRGSELLTNFVKQRLLTDSTGKLHDPIPQNKSKHLLI